jgi:CAAX prenyl protease-like protein
LHSSRAAKVYHVAPFAAFIAMMAADRIFDLPARIFYPLRFAIVLVLLLAARRYISLRPRFALYSVILGAAVFALWVGPDLLFGYRHFWLFENPLTGRAASTIEPALRRNLPFVILRTAGCALLVPVFEELFWRSWLMRWLIAPHFEKIPFGTYARSAFWTVAVLFAVEHGPYWEVGLAAGILYNWWAVRTRSLADCILAHAVTNALLSAFVLFAGQWQYWS